MISPGGGEAGSTDAVHSGSFAVTTPTVQADTLEEALEAAITGNIQVTHSAETHSYGLDLSEGSAFRMAHDGNTATLSSEDLAAFTGIEPDWDYDDRTWKVSTTQLVHESTFTVTDASKTPVQTITVSVRVLMYDNEFEWRYSVYNDNVAWDMVDNGQVVANCGMEAFTLSLPAGIAATDLRDIQNEMGWPYSIGGQSELNPTNGLLLAWYGRNESGPWLMPQHGATFWFRTDPMAIGTNPVQFFTAGYDNNGGGDGPVPKSKIVVEIHDKNDAKVDKIKVAQWENAFESNLQVQEQVDLKLKFPQYDKDRIYYYIEDAAANVNPAVREDIELKIKTPRKEVTGAVLRETGPNTGIFKSRWTLAVSNEADWPVVNLVYVGLSMPDDSNDELRAKNGAPLVLLGDTVTGIYKGVTYKLADVPALHRATVQFYTLKNGAGQPLAGATDIEHYKNQLREAYAQVQVDFKFNETVVVGPIAGVVPADGILVYDLNANGNPQGPADEAKKLIDGTRLQNIDGKVIKIFIVPSFQDAGLTTARGLTIFPGASTQPIPEAYKRVAFISKTFATRFTVPHEVGHVFELEHPVLVNNAQADALQHPRLMFGSTTPQDTPKATKRLWGDDYNIIRLDKPSVFE